MSKEFGNDKEVMDLLQVMVLTKMGMIRGVEDLNPHQRAVVQAAYDSIREHASVEDPHVIEMARVLGFEKTPAPEDEVKPYR